MRLIHFFLLLPVPAFAAFPVIQSEKFSFGGTGCPSSQKPSVAYDSKTGEVTIAFRDYRLDSIRKACSIAIPVVAPKERVIELSDLRVSGERSSRGAVEAVVEVEPFVPGKRGERLSAVVQASEAEFSKDLSRGKRLIATGCGSSMILRLNSSALLKVAPGASGSLEVRELRFRMTEKTCP